MQPSCPTVISACGEEVGTNCVAFFQTCQNPLTMSCDDTSIISQSQTLGPPLVGTGTKALGVVSAIGSVSLFVLLICIVCILLTFLKPSAKDNDGVVPFSQEPKRVPKVRFCHSVPWTC